MYENLFEAMKKRHALRRSKENSDFDHEIVSHLKAKTFTRDKPK